MRILISAAETSSDAHGAELLKAIQKLAPSSPSLSPDLPLEAFGIGGPKLKAAGLRTVVDARDLMAMGFTEVLTKLPRIFSSMRQVSHAAMTTPPDVVVFIDYPDFHFKLAKRFVNHLKFKRLGIPIVYYIPPKVWVWRKKRVEVLRKYFDMILCIFPFEESFYSQFKIHSKFVGNPLVDELPLNLTRLQARENLGLRDSAPVLVLMPGSRRSELKAHFLLMIDAAQLAAKRLRERGVLSKDQPLEVLIPFPVTANLESLPRHPLYPELNIRLSQGNAAECLVAADAGLIKSGTSTLEAALLGCPHTIVYRTTRTTAWIFKNLIRYKGPIGLVNLVARGPLPKPEFDSKKNNLVRELVLDEVTLEALTDEVVSLMSESGRREKMKLGFLALRKEVCGPRHGLAALGGAESNHASPSERAALEIIHLAQQGAVDVGALDSELPMSLARSVVTQILTATLSVFWSLASMCVRGLVWSGLLQSTRLGPRVISVGNIQVGGAGKTPLVAHIANEAVGRNLQVCILSRGYRSAWEIGGGTIYPGSAPCDPNECGDEVALLHDLCPQAFIGVGADRIRAFHRVKEKIQETQGRPIDVVILDDGFQHWKIAKDVNIVAVTSSRVTQTLFRDFPGALQNADLVVWTKGNRRPESQGRPFVRVHYTLPLAPEGSFKDYWLITGVADSSFVRELSERAGYRVVKHLPLPDHFAYGQRFVQKWMAQASTHGARILLTGKDWVKWRALGVEPSQVTVIEPKLSIPSQESGDSGDEYSRAAQALWSRHLWEE